VTLVDAGLSECNHSGGGIAIPMRIRKKSVRKSPTVKLRNGPADEKRLWLKVAVRPGKVKQSPTFSIVFGGTQKGGWNRQKNVELQIAGNHQFRPAFCNPRGILVRV
jgi:hypothetical protein